MSVVWVIGAPLLLFLLELRALCRREHRKDLFVQLLELGRIGLGALRVGLFKRLEKRLDLILLLRAQIQLPEHRHHAAAVLGARRRRARPGIGLP